MRANEFVKKYGWDVAIRLSNEMIGITQDVANCVAYWGQSEWDCLKRLVESYELVEFYGGIDCAKNVDYGNIFPDDVVVSVKQAIADVESCL